MIVDISPTASNLVRKTLTMFAARRKADFSKLVYADDKKEVAEIFLRSCQTYTKFCQQHVQAAIPIDDENVNVGQQHVDDSDDDDLFDQDGIDEFVGLMQVQNDHDG